MATYKITAYTTSSPSWTDPTAWLWYFPVGTPVPAGFTLVSGQTYSHASKYPDNFTDTDDYIVLVDLVGNAPTLDANVTIGYVHDTVGGGSVVTDGTFTITLSQTNGSKWTYPNKDNVLDNDYTADDGGDSPPVQGLATLSDAAKTLVSNGDYGVGGNGSTPLYDDTNLIDSNVKDGVAYGNGSTGSFVGSGGGSGDDPVILL